MSAGSTATLEPRLWDACDDVAAYCDRVTAWEPGLPCPVLVEGRPDLRRSMERAGTVYGAPSSERGAGRTLIVESDAQVRDALGRLLDAIAGGGRVESLEDYRSRPGTEPLIVVARYDRLDHELILRATELVAERDTQLFVLTGRDLPSLSWMIAKQFVRRRPSVDGRAVYSGAATLPAVDGPIVVRDQRGVERTAVDTDLLATEWQQVIFHGHGTEDSINLGDYTVCGLNKDIRLRDDLALRPRCGYGLGCYKDDDKLVRLNELRAAHIVMASCCNATLEPNRFYDPKYLLLLSGIDGVAQSLLVSPVVHDADAADLLSWIDVLRTGAALAGPPNLDDLHPFLSFFQVGSPQRDHTSSARSTLAEPTELVVAAERAHALLDGQLLSSTHPLRGGLETFARKVDLGLARSIRGNADRWRDVIAASRADLASLDLRVAKQILKDPEDPLLDFPQYFGDRSVVDEDSARDVTCMCGLPAREWERAPLVSYIPRVKALVCPRCGDVRFATMGAPETSLTVPRLLSVGETLQVQMLIESDRTITAQVGVFVPRFLRHVYPTPALRRLKLRADRPAELSFDLEPLEGATPQAYYVTAFVIAELSLATVRQRYGIVFREDRL